MKNKAVLAVLVVILVVAMLMFVVPIASIRGRTDTPSAACLGIATDAEEPSSKKFHILLGEKAKYDDAASHLTNLSSYESCGVLVRYQLYL